jgi:limonene-1,2-epoxide hydrolase
MLDHEKTLRSFIAEWGKSFEALIEAFGKYLTGDAVWEKPSVSVTKSAEEAIALLRAFNQNFGAATYESELRHVAVSGNIVFAERIDHVRRSDGSLIVAMPVTGIFEFDGDGRIAVWRDYFDSATIMKALDNLPSDARGSRS